MEPAKIFNNVIIGQFALTGVSLKVYVSGIFLTITDVDDVEDPNMGFGMSTDGEMHPFNYNQVEKLVVSGNDVTIDTYNKGMEAKFKGGEEAPADDAEEKDDAEEGPKKDGMFADKKEESILNLKDLLKEISQDEADAEQLAIDAMAAAGDAKIKSAKEKEKELKKKPIDEVEEYDSKSYTFGTGDIIKNINPSCKHFGSIGVVKSIDNIPSVGEVANYIVMNIGDTYRPGDSLTKTIDQLEPITSIGTEKEEY